MTGFAALWQVARREMRERLRSKAYIITTILTVVVVLALIVLPNLFDSGTEESTVGLIGDGNAEIVETAEQLGNANDEPDAPPSVVIDTVEYPDRNSGEIALEDEEIDALLVDSEEVVVTDTTGFGGSSLTGLLQQAAGAVQIEKVVAEQGEQATDIIELLTNDSLEVTTLAEGDAEDDGGRTLIAYAGLLLLYMAVLLYGTWILTGVTEEKSNRVVEVLVSSVRPWQILGGKIVGIGSLAIAQLFLTLLLAFGAIQVMGAFDIPDLEFTALLNLLLWFVIGFLIFAVMFGAAGSLVSRMEDAQTIAMPMTFTAVAGFFVSIITLDDPTGPVAIIGTYVPVTAPFVVPVRAALGAISAWEYALSVAICIVSIYILTRIAGRIYAGALLKFGSKVSWREAWKASKA